MDPESGVKELYNSWLLPLSSALTLYQSLYAIFICNRQMAQPWGICRKSDNNKKKNKNNVHSAWGPPVQKPTKIQRTGKAHLTISHFYRATLCVARS